MQHAGVECVAISHGNCQNPSCARNKKKTTRFIFVFVLMFIFSGSVLFPDEMLKIDVRMDVYVHYLDGRAHTSRLYPFTWRYLPNEMISVGFPRVSGSVRFDGRRSTFLRPFAFPRGFTNFTQLGLSGNAGINYISKKIMICNTQSTFFTVCCCAVVRKSFQKDG